VASRLEKELRQGLANAMKQLEEYSKKKAAKAAAAGP
jgi:hypothetical protein